LPAAEQRQIFEDQTVTAEKATFSIRSIYQLKMIRRIFISLVFMTVAFILFHVNALLLGQKIKTGKSECGNLKKPSDVLVDNVIWQVLETSKGRVSLLNAYLDTRLNRKVVRINALGPNFNKTFSNIHCQFWFEDGKVKTVRVSTFISLWITASTTSIKRILSSMK
jgi:hypothetical protein